MKNAHHLNDETLNQVNFYEIGERRWYENQKPANWGVSNDVMFLQSQAALHWQQSRLFAIAHSTPTSHLITKELRLRRSAKFGIFLSSGSTILLSASKVESRFRTISVSVPFVITFYSLSRQRHIKKKAVSRFYDLTKED